MRTQPAHHRTIARRAVSLALAAVMAATVPTTPGLAADDPGGTPVAVAADVTVDGARTEVVVALSRPVPATTFLLSRPDRVVVDLPGVNCQVPAEAIRIRGSLVSGLRCGLAAAGRSRLILTLAMPALATIVAAPPGAAPPGGIGADGRWAIRLERVDRVAFERAVASDKADLALTTGSISPTPGRDTRPLVAIDAGHGGVDPGATAPTGAVEKDITLAFAEALRDRLGASGRYRILMIRDGDVFVPLDERVHRARSAGADLFLSIHADTIASAQVGGATIYTGSDEATDSEAEHLAERENAADGGQGGGGHEPPSGVTDILQELTLRETRTFSHRFSGFLFRDLGAGMRFSQRPQREAGFRVLRTADLPAVLIELGYLSNAADLGRMTSDAWRRRNAAGMAGALDRFFAPRMSAEPRIASGAALSP